MRSADRTALWHFMINEPAMIVRPLSGWQLLADHTVSGQFGDDQPLLAPALAVEPRVILRPQQLERIRQTLLRAIARAASLPLRIRIWRMGSCTGDCGWGFFLVERQSDMTDGETVYLVELFLYQERES